MGSRRKGLTGRLSVVEKLRGALVGDENILLAYLFGSVAKGIEQPLSDVDVAVLLKDDSLERRAEVLWRMAKALRLSEEKIDLVDLGRADLHLKYNIVKDGIKLVDRGFGDGLIKELVESYPAFREDLRVDLRLWAGEDPCIDEAVVSKRVDEILKNAALVKERYVGKPLSWLVEDLERMLALERAFERIVEAMVDVCRHVVSVKMLGIAESRAEYPMRLAHHQLMQRELAERIAELVRLRNILAHRYLEVDYERLHAKAKDVVEGVVPAFVTWAKRLLSSERGTTGTNP